MWEYIYGNARCVECKQKCKHCEIHKNNGFIGLASFIRRTERRYRNVIYSIRIGGTRARIVILYVDEIAIMSENKQIGHFNTGQYDNNSIIKRNTVYSEWPAVNRNGVEESICSDTRIVFEVVFHNNNLRGMEFFIFFFSFRSVSPRESCLREDNMTTTCIMYTGRSFELYDYRGICVWRADAYTRRFTADIQ